MPYCEFCNKIYVNVKQHITKTHSYCVRYSNLEDGGVVQLYRGEQMIGEQTNWQDGNNDWLECWFCDGDDWYWVQWNVVEKITQSNFYIIKNNGVDNKEEETIYCKFIQTN